MRQPTKVQCPDELNLGFGRLATLPVVRGPQKHLGGRIQWQRPAIGAQVLPDRLKNGQAIDIREAPHPASLSSLGQIRRAGGIQRDSLHESKIVSQENLR